MTTSKIKYSESTILPNNFLAEQAVLNILLTNPSLIENCLSKLNTQCFYFEPHSIIFNAIFTLSENRKPINVTTVITFLQDKCLLESIGGLQRIINIVNRFENFSDLDEYIKLLKEKYVRRLMIESGKQIILWGYTTSKDTNIILNEIEQLIFNLNENTNADKIYNSAEIMDEVFQDMISKIKKDESLGLKSSYYDLDSIVQGFQKSDLVIIAGRPSMGKTAFALNLGKNIVSNYNIPLVLFTLEMSRQQIIYRFISTEAKINANKLKSNKMTEIEWKMLSEAMTEISQMPIFIDDNPNLTVLDIRNKLRKIFLGKEKDGVVIIDYLQLLQGTLKNENRVQEISLITRNLKILAKEFNIPIIVLSQLSRSVESRINKRPMLSDLRESGCISAKNFSKTSLNESLNKNNIIKNSVLDFKLKGIKPTFKITFENSTEIFLTSNHCLLTQKGWTRIIELNNQASTYCVGLCSKNKKAFNYQKIKCFNYIGLQEVYDKTVPVLHNYLKDGVILHNSIEQDADIVIMLYREEYYTEKNSNPHITEFIVAKHRNGPIGTAKLLFDPTLTTFSNI
jgi:replicative DNA helicase